MNHTPLARSYRSGNIEGVHDGSVAVVNAEGKLLYSANNPHLPTYLRSSIKMIQAMPVLMSGAAEQFEFTDAELALCCASHTGAAYHLKTVAEMLRKIGETEDALGCGAHNPENKETREALICSGTAPGQIHNNCSGKHTGMLAVCRAKGWPLENYLAPEHPLQQWILQLLAQHAGVDPSTIPYGIDGCSLPTYFMPISTGARVTAAFVQNAISGSDPVSARIMNAVAAYPEMINEHGGYDTELIRAMKGRCIAKRGAMGILLAGIDTVQYGPIGIAVKLDDGIMTPMHVVMMRVLDRLGVLLPEEAAELESFRKIEIRNWKGTHVGETVAEFELEPAGA